MHDGGYRSWLVKHKMADLSPSLAAVASLLIMLLLLFLTTTTASASASSSVSGLRLNYYSESCPRAEEIVKEQVKSLYEEHGNTAVSWLRALFHDCMVKSCDASLLLDTSGTGTGIVSEKSASRSFGMRNFKYMDTIKAALEEVCPTTVSCADVLALAARDGVAMLGGPPVPMRTGRRDSRDSYYADVDKYIPNHNETVSVVLSRFASLGVDAEGTVALLGAHSVGRVHCSNLVARLYPSTSDGMDPAYGEYLRVRCPTADARDDTRDVEYARNDRKTPMVLDNMYHKNLMAGKGLLLVDQRLASDPRTAPFVRKMAQDNVYFRERFAAALARMSENSPLTGGEGEVRKDCRFVNAAT